MDLFSLGLNQERTILYLKVKKENWSQHLEKKFDVQFVHLQVYFGRITKTPSSHIIITSEYSEYF